MTTRLQRLRSPEPARVALVVAVLLACVLVGSQLSARQVEVDMLLGDLWVEVDAIWRSHLGQQPNRDFITPIGPFFYGVYRLLLTFEPPSLAVMIHGNLLVGVAAGLLAYGISARSAPREAVVLLVLLVFLTASSGRALGTPLAAQAVPYIVPYNRWAWAIAIPCAFGLLAAHPRGARLPWILVGLALAALFFLKLSYFAALCGLAGAALLIDARSGEGRGEILRRAVLLSASLAVSLALGALLSAPVEYWNDVRTIAAANYVAFRLFKFVLQLPEAGLMFGFAIVVCALAGRQRGVAIADAARLFLMAACGAAIMSQNHENNEAPLYYGALILAYTLGRSRGGSEDPAEAQRETGPALSFYLLLLLLLVPMTADAGTAAVARLRAATGPQGSIPQFADTPLADLRSADRAEIPKVVDGLGLLARVGQGEGTVLPFTMGNPFSALTNTRSPRGGMAISYYGRTFSEHHRPPPERLLGDADFLLIRKADATSAWMWRLYEPQIRARYTLAGESDHWTVWRRSGGVAVRGAGS